MFIFLQSVLLGDTGIAQIYAHTPNRLRFREARTRKLKIS